MGHLYKEAVQHLPTVCARVELTSNELSEKKCERCCKTNSKEIVSRRPTDRPSKPYFEVHWDLIYVKLAEGLTVYCMHFYCPFTHIHHVYFSNDKKELTLIATAKSFCRYVERRWNYKVRIFRSDNESARGGEWTL